MSLHEELSCALEAVGIDALAGAGLVHEVVVGVRGDIDCVAEFADRHLSGGEIGSDLAPDLIGVPVLDFVSDEQNEQEGHIRGS